MNLKKELVKINKKIGVEVCFFLKRTDNWVNGLGEFDSHYSTKINK